MTLKLAIVASYAGLSVGGAYMLTLIPNIEIFSALLFLGGMLFGKKLGVFIALVAALIYGLFNIYGASPWPLLIVQLGCYAGLGLIGGFCKESRAIQPITRRTQGIFGLIGISFAFVYTMLADIIFPLFTGGQYTITLWILYGMPMRFVLMTCDLITFSQLVPLVYIATEKHLRSIFPHALEL
ncbi:MAG: hypothetical protein Q6353_011520 [Candidatus Sigynarchaeum springense]